MHTHNSHSYRLEESYTFKIDHFIVSSITILSHRWYCCSHREMKKAAGRHNAQLPLYSEIISGPLAMRGMWACWTVHSAQENYFPVLTFYGKVYPCADKLQSWQDAAIYRSVIHALDSGNWVLWGKSEYNKNDWLLYLAKVKSKCTSGHPGTQTWVR